MTVSYPLQAFEQVAGPHPTRRQPAGRATKLVGIAITIAVHVADRWSRR